MESQGKYSTTLDAIVKKLTIQYPSWRKDRIMKTANEIFDSKQSEQAK